ncbi:MAG: cysteine hydrolase [Lachnospiraceae bacterium]|nr:cysteine hydrolase [Lachnospiraceae bacterium]
MKVLIVVDMQKDFVNGALGSAEAEAIVPAVAEKIRSFDGEVFYTRDTHMDNYLLTQEGKNLPVVHCIKNSPGWQIIPELQPVPEERVINKPSFGSTELPRKLKDFEEEKGEAVTEITLIGLCTDICVISNAMILKASFPEVPILVDPACCAGVSPESHQNALDAMKCCQIGIL